MFPLIYNKDFLFAQNYFPKMSSSNKKLSSNNSIIVTKVCRILIFTVAIIYLGAIIFFSYPPNYCTKSNLEVIKHLDSNYIPINHFDHSNSLEANNNIIISPTNISHLLFGLMGSEKGVHLRRVYNELWWRKGETKGYIYLDKAPTGNLLPWPPTLPPYRIYDDINKLVKEIRPRDPVIFRMNHGIFEIIRENKDFRWLVLGDDDTMFFIENLVDVLAKYDHTKYYYIGGQSEFIMENYMFSFLQGFGGGGIILSYPLAKALAKDMENCLRRTSHLFSSDQIAMACIGDIGVTLTPIKGLNQIDFRGDLSGFLSSHPRAPVLSLHHLDMVDPIFPKMNRFKAVTVLMKAAKFDQSRLLQQTVCHNREQNWTFSTSWGYSVHIYEKILPRWWLQYPIETFSPWLPTVKVPPLYMFNTRKPFGDPCATPHVFFFRTIRKISENVIRTSYFRSAPRRLRPCMINGNHTANHVAAILVYSPATKRKEIDRCECCKVDYEKGANIIRITYRQCRENEIIA